MSENIMYKNIADKMKQANKEIEELKAKNQELQDSITWWNNRYNALQRDYEELKQENERLKLELSGYREAILRDDKLLGLQQRIEKAIAFIEVGKTFDNEDTEKTVVYLQSCLLNILNGDKE